MDTNSNSLTAKQPVFNATVSSSSPTKVPPFLFLDGKLGWSI